MDHAGSENPGAHFIPREKIFRNKEIEIARLVEQGFADSAANDAGWLVIHNRLRSHS